MIAASATACLEPKYLKIVWDNGCGGKRVNECPP